MTESRKTSQTIVRNKSGWLHRLHGRGPVLGNYVLDNLRFVKPVKPGDSMRVQLTAKSKTARNADYGEVRWAVTLTNQANETVATYDLLTMNAM